MLLVILLLLHNYNDSNNGNKVYAKQTTCNTIFSPPDNRFTASPQAATAEPRNHGFCKFRKTPEKDQTPGKEKI